MVQSLSHAFRQLTSLGHRWDPKHTFRNLEAQTTEHLPDFLTGIQAAVLAIPWIPDLETLATSNPNVQFLH